MLGLRGFLFLGLGFVSSKADSPLFVVRSPIAILLILVYVDGIIVTGSNSLRVTQLISQLDKEFFLNDLGHLHYFLSIEVIHTSDGLF